VSDMRITAKTITGLLAGRHREDVFIPECKGGPTWGGEHDRMDAWAMKKSWSRPLVSAYEIKVSRSDFLADKKWPNYLAYCNAFWFVCPKGVIERDEVPADAGLIYVATTGTRLFTAKAAPWRKVEIPDDLWRYILMSRACVVDEHQQKPFDRAEYFKGMIEDRMRRREIGRHVGAAASEHVNRIEAENTSLRRRIEMYAKFRRRLKEMGLNPDDQYTQWRVDSELDKLREAVPPWVSRTLADAKRALDAIEQLVGAPA
jgi:hypothetical protein